MNTELVLPKDLKRKRNLNICKNLIPFVLLESLAIVVLVFWGKLIFQVPLFYDHLLIYVRIAGYTALLVLPIFVTNLPKKLKDRTIYGIIEKIEVKRDATNKKDPFPSVRLIYKNILYIHVRNYDGELVRRKVYESFKNNADWDDEKGMLDKYQEGDLIFHLYGSVAYIHVPTKADTYVKCAACANVNPITEEKCEICTHTLIKSKEQADNYLKKL